MKPLIYRWIHKNEKMKKLDIKEQDISIIPK